MTATIWEPLTNSLFYSSNLIEFFLHFIKQKTYVYTQHLKERKNNKRYVLFIFYIFIRYVCMYFLFFILILSKDVILLSSHEFFLLKKKSYHFFDIYHWHC